MHFERYSFFGKCSIFYIQFFFMTGKAMLGENVERACEGEFPSTVAIANRDDSHVQLEIEQFCGGVLITRTNVLTAAHCFEDSQLNQTQIIIGSVDIRCGLRYYPLWWVEYNRWAHRKRMRIEFRINDIGIIKLSETVPDIIELGVMSMIRNTDLYGSYVQVTGWGMDADDDHTRFMNKVTLEVLSKDECETRIQNLIQDEYTIHVRHLCSVAEPYALMHYGDSGNPVYYNGKIVAIHKSTNPFPDVSIHPEKINVHTGIEYYRRFILDVLRNEYVWF